MITKRCYLHLNFLLLLFTKCSFLPFNFASRSYTFFSPPASHDSGLASNRPHTTVLVCARAKQRVTTSSRTLYPCMDMLFDPLHMNKHPEACHCSSLALSFMSWFIVNAITGA